MKPNAANGKRLCKNVNAPINGAVSKQIRAKTMHENVYVGRIWIGTTVLVQVTNTACEHVVATFEIIANVMPSVTYAIFDTMKWKKSTAVHSAQMKKA